MNTKATSQRAVILIPLTNNKPSQAKMIGQNSRLVTALLLLFLFVIPSCLSFPLSTNKRWLVDDATGERVKLACINWASHIGPMLAEGLDKKPLEYLVSQIADHGYTCVRFLWATYMWTRPEYANLTVEASFDALNLTLAKTGLAKYNPFLLNMTLHQAFDTVVDAMGANNLTVVLDNHVSMPIWCCDNDDGNGFFGDRYFDPEEWALGLTTVAQRFHGTHHVVAIGTRNELRGRRENVLDWYKYVQYGATKIHEVNPDVLTIASGLDYATNLAYLKNQTWSFNNNNKLVMEAHQYSWSDEPPTQWVTLPVNQHCSSRTQNFYDKNLFILNGTDVNYQYPIFMGEIGINEKNTSLSEIHFMDCFISFMAERDMDWGLWAFQGSYYLRQNMTNPEEEFAMMNFYWSGLNNPFFQAKLWILKHKLQDPSSSAPTSYILYHPQSGGCAFTNDHNRSIRLRSCRKKGWTNFVHAGDNSTISVNGTQYCLRANGDGEQATLSVECSGSQSLWRSISPSKLHLATTDANGNDLCLHVSSEDRSLMNTIVARKCICVGDDPNCLEDPTMQWFKLVPTNVY